MYLINTIERVKEFVDICLKYDFPIEVITSNGDLIDGKSVLGMFSIDITQPLKVKPVTQESDERRNFFAEIEFLYHKEME